MSNLRTPFVLFSLINFISTASGNPVAVEVNQGKLSVNESYPANYYGVDVSEPYGSAAFSCLHAANLRFAIVRCYESVGRVDPNCAGTVNNAHAGGMERVDAYMFPCPKCGNAAGQVGSLYNYFVANKVRVETVWLDIEGSQYWLGNAASNQAFYTDLVDACEKIGLKIGVYSSLNNWETIFGSRSFSKGSNHPLWYAHYDGVPEFSDFSSFGGWGSPTFKQFSDAGSKCGVSYDISWGPGM
eukprot:m.258091 g.258091  ORF g.258091 m.258091 type:complete len:242 (-) comp36094_c0_seq1:267-992(-)